MKVSKIYSASNGGDATQQPRGYQHSPSMTPRLPGAHSILSLPAEIRNQIYEYVLEGWLIAIRTGTPGKDGLGAAIWPITTDPFQIVGIQSLYCAERPSRALSLLYTCRQIHAETRLLPYGLSALLIGERPFSHTMIEKVCVQLAQIRRLKLCSSTPPNIVLSRVWLEMLPWFKELSEIEVYWQLRVPPWGSEEDHLSTATADEIDMKKKIKRATSSACKISFHCNVIWQ